MRDEAESGCSINTASTPSRLVPDMSPMKWRGAVFDVVCVEEFKPVPLSVG